MSNILTKLAVLGACLSVVGFAHAKPYGEPSSQRYAPHGKSQYYDRGVEYARVVAATPIYRQVKVSQPRQECWYEQVPVRSSNNGGSITNEVVGGIIGGAIGNALGSHKSNKKVGAVVGAVLGASIAHDIQPRSQQPVSYREQRHCRQVSHQAYEQRLDGYDVTYRYQGRQYQTQMDHHPGDRVAVQVSVTPVKSRR